MEKQVTFSDDYFPGLEMFMREYIKFRDVRREMGEPTPTFEFYMYKRFMAQGFEIPEVKKK